MTPSGQQGVYAAVICWGGESPEKLKRALLSLNNQQTVPTQVVLVGDGLPAEDVDQFRLILPNMTLAVTPERIGPAGARNFGMTLLESRIEFVLIQDADDISHPARASSLLSALEDLSLDAVGSQAVLITPKKGKIFGLPPRPTSQADVRKDLLNGKMAFVHPSIMFRINLFHQVGGYPDITERGEDFAMLHAFALAGGKLANLPENLYGYDHQLFRSFKAYREDTRIRMPDGKVAVTKYLKHILARIIYSHISKKTKTDWTEIMQDTQTSNL